MFLLICGMSIFNSIVTSALPFLPKWFAKPFARPYVAGENMDEALEQIKTLNQKGFSATIDILGEHTKTIDLASNITNQYCTLYEKIFNESLDCSISVKPTHVGLDISMSEALVNLRKIRDKAKEFDNFLRIDMESSKVTDQTIEIFNQIKPDYSKIGLVMQAYLHRAQSDVEALSNQSFNARICKGIYNESKHVAYKSRQDIKNNFLILAKHMASKGSFCAYATHDQDLINDLLEWIRAEKIHSELFEFQVLYGVPMNGRLEELINKGFKVRVYVPFGPDWYDYSLRRLNENPKIASYVIGNLLKSA